MALADNAPPYRDACAGAMFFKAGQHGYRSTAIAAAPDGKSTDSILWQEYREVVYGGYRS